MGDTAQPHGPRPHDPMLEAPDTENTPSPARASPSGPVVARLLARPRWEIELGAAIAITVSFVVMAVRIGDEPFWVDESIAVLPARSILFEGVPRSPFDLDFMAPQLEDGLWDPSAPLYRYSVALMAAVFGFSEASTRLWSLALGALALIPCWLLARRLYGPTVATMAVALLATLPAFADHAREARHFTFVACAWALALWALCRADEGGPEGARWPKALWPTALWAAVLGHAVGYLVVPVVSAFAVASRMWRRADRFFDRRLLWLYGLLAVTYGAIQAAYGNTLPFLHDIGCHNRAEACHPELTYYAGTLASFLVGGDRALWEARSLWASDPWAVAPAALPIVLAAAGCALTARDAVGDRDRRSGHLSILAWFWVPLLLLSSQEVKFPRYVFYVLPPLMLWVARSIEGLSGWRRWGPGGRAVRLALFVACCLLPQLTLRHDPSGPSLAWTSRTLEHARGLLVPRDDNWERLRAQAELLRANAGDDDIIVTSFDDAGLGYYLGRFVHGFLNSAHDDAYFVGLLQEAAARGARVWFIDTLPAHNYCHAPGPPLTSIDCRRKYLRFYLACHPEGGAPDPTCTRLVF